MFVDASAIVAILTGEAGSDQLADRLDQADTPITSPIAIFEAALGIRRKRHSSVEAAATDVREFLTMARVQIMPISPQDSEAALAAFARYGKGQGHPAQLNLGDCFTYAVAKTITPQCCLRAMTSAERMSRLRGDCSARFDCHENRRGGHEDRLCMPLSRPPLPPVMTGGWDGCSPI